MWNTGVVVGPFAVGIAMDQTGPSGLPWTIVGFYVLVATVILVRGRAK
jgi:hypothetical protein